jgi:pyruvate dehydrogenase E1 component alpha subunit/2-oxoisovalerate dehydrogenase E1 component alpha subunit
MNHYQMKPNTSPLSILRPDGTWDAKHEPNIPKKTLCRVYSTMVLLRAMDERCLTLQRQGRISFYGAATGQEAVVAAAAALDDGDWVFPALREAGVLLYRGFPLDKYAAQLYGSAEDILKGRQMPCHYGSRDQAFVTLSSPIGTQIPQAVGAAMAAKILRDGRVAAGFMGDGATSEGDFHVGMNFAGVYKAPVILYCQNNQFSISVPVSSQTSSETLAVKAIAYGFEGVRVDGNDVLAVYAATKTAADRARAGGGPTFIEALTYRIGAHSTSDDPSRYRDERITEDWKKRDPIARFRLYLLAKDILKEKDDVTLRKETDARIRAALKQAESVPPPTLETLFEDVYADLPWHLREQMGELRFSLDSRG